MWLTSGESQSYRPDQLGVVMELRCFGTQQRLVRVVIMSEFIVGSLDSEAVREVRRQLLEEGYTLLWRVRDGHGGYLKTLEFSETLELDPVSRNDFLLNFPGVKLVT
ncbi:MAG: hypothetical protein ACI9VM_000172 [Candidatus Azotimanducaceae bacterium]|jgi:hypothetical protein